MFSMPYTEAVISETLRLSSFAPLGLMNRTLYDTNFQGFLIQKDTIVIGNLYSIHYNPEHWSDPHQFRPERFLLPDGEKIKNPDYFLPFHVGRRKCAGEHFAMDSLFLFITSIFQKFHIAKYHENGKLDFDSIPGLTRSPKPFCVKIQNRMLKPHQRLT